MAAIALTNVKLYAGGYDLTTDTNNAVLNFDSMTRDATTFGSNGWSEVKGTLKTTQLAYTGLWDASVDAEEYSGLGVANTVYTMAPTGTEGDVAYMFRATRSEYRLLDGQIGDLAAFNVTAAGSDGYGTIRGSLLKSKGNVSATGATGSVVQVGAVGASQYLYCALHVFSAGTTITVQVQSDDNAGMTSPTTRATFSGVTAAGGTWATRVAGAITDTYWRVNVSAITGTFQIAAAVGVGS